MTHRSLTFVVSVFAVLSVAHMVRAEEKAFAPEQIEFFEKQVRPLFVEHCQKCHDSAKQKGNLRLDSLAAVLKGGGLRSGDRAGEARRERVDQSSAV